MLTHIIFDFDGVIVNSDSFHLWVIRDVLKTKNLPFDGEIYKSFFQGRRLVEAFTLYLQSFNKLGELVDCIERKRTYDSHYADNVTAYKDTLTFIAEAKRTHVLAIVTSTRRVLLDAALTKFHLNYSFQTTIAAEDCARGKPDPDPYVTAMRLLKTMPRHVLVIEDSPLGIVAAKAAQMKCLAVTHTHPPEELKDADWVTHTLATVDLVALSKLGEEPKIETEEY
jgi:HAD superfamily hydrolase (TIGR01509 family)